MKRFWTIILILFLMFISAFAGYQIYREQSEYRSGEGSYEELEQYVTLPDPKPEKVNSTESGESESTEPIDNINWPEVNFIELQAVNPDIIGWLYIEGTTINYPIVQGKDNSYYLRHLADGTPNSSGAIFMDSRNDCHFTDTHTVIYGHHMKNGTMFSALDGYKKQEFYEDHPVVLIMTLERNYQIELFAGYVTDVESDAWQLGFTDEAFERWIERTKEKSMFHSEWEPEVTDQIVTFSTCSYEFSNARFVLCGYIR